MFADGMKIDNIAMLNLCFFLQWFPYLVYFIHLFVCLALWTMYSGAGDGEDITCGFYYVELALNCKP